MVQSPKETAFSKLFQEFLARIQNKYSGALDIQLANGQKFNFYYHLGRIVWATGTYHPFRRWRRQMIQYYPEFTFEKLKLRSSDINVEYWDYQFLISLYKQGVIEAEKVDAIASNIILELLFDLVQQASSTSFTWECNPQISLNLPNSSVNATVFLKRMEKDWSTWRGANLAQCSPNLAPVLKQPDQLIKLVPPNVYKNFANLMKGEYTLRDLSIKMKQGVLQVTHSLMPYITQKCVALVEIPDLALPGVEFNKKDTANNTPTAKAPATTSKSPLIACIDDSPQVGLMLEKILSSHGMRSVSIQDPIQALPVLIERKPDFIFLDLIMPVINGYELCSQIRRVPTFAQTPIVILTGSDGLLDRVRAKVVGCTDFITKPVVDDKVMAAINRYLQIKQQA